MDGEDNEAALEKAAVQIQSRARGYLERKKLKQKKSMASNQLPVAVAECPCPEGEQLSDGEALEKAAVKIQSRARGYLERKKLKKKKKVCNPSSQLSTADQECCCADEGEQQSDDVKQEAAATKIQAGARGYLTRSRLKRCPCRHDMFKGHNGPGSRDKTSDSPSMTPG
jgi:myosin heavy subunit